MDNDSQDRSSLISPREMKLQGILSADARLEQLERDMLEVKATLMEHGMQRAKIQADVSLLLTIIADIKVGFNFVIRLAQILKWFAGLCISITAIWGLLNAIESGHPHSMELPPVGKE